MKLRKVVHWSLGTLGVLLIAGALFVHFTMGWSMLIGILRYDSRRESALVVGDVAPAVKLYEPESAAEVRMFEHPPARPVILVFGSFT